MIYAVKFAAEYGILSSMMGLRTRHRPRFRIFCCLLAGFWTGMILLGVVRLAFAAPAKPYTSRTAAATHAAFRCPMCAAMAHAGVKSGMKCCCCHGGGMTTSCACACRPRPQPATLAVLVWSPLAVLPAEQFLVQPLFQTSVFSSIVPKLMALCRAPCPRPPRLL